MLVDLPYIHAAGIAIDKIHQLLICQNFLLWHRLPLTVAELISNQLLVAVATSPTTSNCMAWLLADASLSVAEMPEKTTSSVEGPVVRSAIVKA